MASAPADASGSPIEQLRTLLVVLKTPALARMYAYSLRTTDVTVGELIDELDVPQGTAYEYVRTLENAGLFEKTRDQRPFKYEAKIVSLTLSSDDETRTITPELIAAVAARSENEDIDVFLDRHGIDGLASALEHAREYVSGSTNHRIAARELDISPLEAEIVLQALEPIVLEYDDDR